MKTIQTHAKYVEWLSAEEMHKASQSWLSELRFIKDEHLFFEDLIKTYIFQLIDLKNFSDSKEIIGILNKSQKKNKLLIESVKIHESELKIMVDGINQHKEEQAYKDEHRGLIVLVSEFLKEYRVFKTQLFDVIKKIMKTEKGTHLIDKK